MHIENVKMPQWIEVEKMNALAEKFVSAIDMHQFPYVLPDMSIDYEDRRMMAMIGYHFTKRVMGRTDFFPETELFVEEKPMPVFALPVSVQRPVTCHRSEVDGQMRFVINREAFKEETPIIAIRFACDFEELEPTVIEDGLESCEMPDVLKCGYTDWEFYRVIIGYTDANVAVLKKNCPPLCAVEVAHWVPTEGRLYKLLDFYE